MQTNRAERQRGQTQQNFSHVMEGQPQGNDHPPGGNHRHCDASWQNAAEFMAAGFGSIHRNGQFSTWSSSRWQTAT